MDNQQGSLVSKDFVGGLIVGEGCFNITYIKQRNGREEYRPQFSLAMCDEDTIQAVEEAFRSWGLAFYHYSVKPKNGRRPYHAIQVSGYKRVNRLCDEMKTYLTGDKRKAADCIDQFVKGRLANKGKGRYAPFTDNDMALYRQLKLINKPA